MRRGERIRFDSLLERVIETLPDRVRALLQDSPLIVEDRPDPRLLEQLGIDPDEETLCGLHSGTPITDRSVLDGPDAPETIHLFREGIVAEAGGWEAGLAAVEAEIRITVLHEVGHHFGLDEDDLERLGYD